MVKELLINILEVPLEGGVGGHMLPRVGEKETGHLGETGGQIAPKQQLVIVIQPARVLFTRRIGLNIAMKGRKSKTELLYWSALRTSSTD